MSNHEKKNIGRVNQLSLFIILINCTVGLFVYVFLARSLLLLAGIFTETILALVPLYLNLRGYPGRAAFALYLVLSGATFFFCSLIGNAAIANLMGAVLIASGGFLFSDRKSRICSYLIAIFVVWGVQENEVIGLIPEIKFDQPNYSRLLFTAYCVAVFLILTMVGWISRSGESRDNALKSNDNEVQAGREDLSISPVEEKLAVPKYGPVDIRSIFEEVKGNYQGLAHIKGVLLVCNVSVRFPELIESDKRMLRSIVSHLVRNAIQFSPINTTVRVGAYVKGLFLNIVVEDQGFGIPPIKKSRLFEPGTSLYYTRRLVLALGGNIEAFNKETEGVMFVVSWVAKKS
jgi:signal transduction histidine kinase